jgi:hypothetical protein
VNGPRLFRVRPKISHGPVFAEASLDRADYETAIADLMTGQHRDPLRVVMFNTDTDRAEDVSRAISQEILRRLGLEGRNVPSELERFIELHAGRDRQLILRLASWQRELIGTTAAILRRSCGGVLAAVAKGAPRP